jgi:transcriptional regulator with XRE-family HTH domain
MKISEKIRYFRQQKGYSQEDMASLLGMSVTGYAKMERSNNPKFEWLIKIAEILEVSLNDLAVTNDKNVVYITGNNKQVTGQINQIHSFENLETENEKLKLEVAFLKEKNFLLETRIKDLEKQIIFLEKEKNML